MRRVLVTYRTADGSQEEKRGDAWGNLPAACLFKTTHGENARDLGFSPLNDLVFLEAQKKNRLKDETYKTSGKDQLLAKWWLDEWQKAAPQLRIFDPPFDSSHKPMCVLTNFSGRSTHFRVGERFGSQGKFSQVTHRRSSFSFWSKGALKKICTNSHKKRGEEAPLPELCRG